MSAAAGAFFAALFYGAAALMAAGLAWRVYGYARTPAPLKIPTTPAPTTRAGVALRMAREVALFESLFKGGFLLWAMAWVFHAALAYALLRHLRYFTEPTPALISMLSPWAMYAGLAMLAALAGLWARRFLIDRVRYISTPSDHLMLALLAAITVSGLAMKNIAHTDVVAVKDFFLGLMAFQVRGLPTDALLLAHLGLVAALAIVFPFSKLLHAPGIFFSPTRNQADNPREVRHLAPWAAALEAGDAPPPLGGGGGRVALAASSTTLSPALPQGGGSK